MRGLKDNFFWHHANANLIKYNNKVIILAEFS